LLKLIINVDFGLWFGLGLLFGVVLLLSVDILSLSNSLKKLKIQTLD
jgi:hypothetical protein